MSYASVTIVGNLGKDPETRNAGESNQLCRFSVASNKNKRNKDGTYSNHTTWWNCVAFGKTAETIAKNFKKGEGIVIVGEPSLEEFTGQDGVTRNSLEVSVNAWSFGEKRKGESAPAQTTTRVPLDPDDIPF